MSSGPITALTPEKKAIFFLLSVEAGPECLFLPPNHTARHSPLERNNVVPDIHSSSQSLVGYYPACGDSWEFNAE